MNKLVHYILIAIMFNWNIAVFAEEENKGCKWEVVEETDTYIQESCVGGEDGSFQARIRSKPVDGSIVIVEAPKKNKKKAKFLFICLMIIGMSCTSIQKDRLILFI